MEKFQDVLTRITGDDQGVVPVAGVQVLVQTSPGGLTAVIYSDDGITPTTNPLTTDSEGRFAFYAANGNYLLSWTSQPLIADGTYGPITLGSSGGGSVNFADFEVPSGLINSANKVYTLVNAPSPAASLDLRVNGQTVIGGGVDYTLAGLTITFAGGFTALASGDTLVASYRY